MSLRTIGLNHIAAFRVDDSFAKPLVFLLQPRRVALSTNKLFHERTRRSLAHLQRASLGKQTRVVYICHTLHSQNLTQVHRFRRLRRRRRYCRRLGANIIIGIYVYTVFKHFYFVFNPLSSLNNIIIIIIQPLYTRGYISYERARI